ncbi:MAG: imidazoleglycerol-phosphate dehydratase HisB [Candidatus Walczuchella monophlebidarum]
MKKKFLFIEREGPLIRENTTQVIFYPGVFSFLYRIFSELDYELVIGTNQEGLGPENFWPIQEYIMKTFEGEGIYFSSVHIYRTLAKENAYTRKSCTDMLLTNYDISNSFFIGDLITYVLLAKNLGCKAIWMNKENCHPSQELNPLISFETVFWKKIYEYLKFGLRCYTNRRITNETDIKIYLQLYGTGKTNIHTGLGFLNHMLEQIGCHGKFDLTIKVRGDLHIDEHHTIEDIGLALGATFTKALGDKKGIVRSGYSILPMDDSLAKVAMDLGGRSHLVWKVNFVREKIGDVPTEMFSHFFKSFSNTAHCNIHIQAEGKNEHHKIEAIFKAFARTLHMIIRRNINDDELPTTKGML